VAELTDATEGLLLLQLPPTLPLLVNVVDKPVHTDDAPLSVPALASGFTVTSFVALDVPQTRGDPTVYIMVVLPSATPVTTPVVGFTVATPGVVPLQLPPLLPLALKLIVEDTHTDARPLTVPASGSELTITFIAAVDEPQLLVTV
jgi:hypothetical protein